jgi:hypothetical protein
MSSFKQYLADTKQAVVWAVKHPSTVRKAIVSVLASVIQDVVVFTAVVPLPANVVAIVATVKGVLVGVLTFLTSNKVVAVTDGTPPAA